MMAPALSAGQWVQQSTGGQSMRANLCTGIMRQTRGVLTGVLLCLLALGVRLAVAADPPRQETVILAFDADLPTMDPHMHILRTGVITFYHMFDNLVVRDLKTMQIVPHLATAWKTIDELTWEFTLRQDVTFHNGDKFTAHTVKFNYDRCLNPEQKCPQRGNHAKIKEVQVVDDYTVRFLTHDPYPIMLERMQNFQMVSEKVAKDKGDAFMAENPIGTGPYKFVHWLKGREILMERNDNYWGPKPAFKYAKIRIIPDKATQVADLLAGGVDLVRALPPDQIEVLKASGAAYVTTAPVLRTAFIQLDSQGRTEKNPFMDKRVRQAVNYGVNTDKIIQFVLNGQAVRTANVLNPMAFGFDPNVKPYPYDPDKAKKLLAEAGYANGFEVRFLSTGADVPAQKQAAEAIQADLAKIGVRVKINHIEDTNSVVAQVKEGKGGPMFQWSWGYYSVFDADGILYDIFHSGNPWAYYWSEETDKLIDEGRSTLNQERRKQIYSKVQQILTDEAAHLYMWSIYGIWGVHKRITWSAPSDEIDRLFLATLAGK
jgi:peptide/nickel transport system substrate-binding protein